MNTFLQVVIFGLCASTLFVPRNKVFIPLLLSACYFSVTDSIEIETLAFPAYRLVMVAALIRVLVMGEFTYADQTDIVKTVVIWAIYSLFVYTILYGSFSAFVLKAGKVLDVIGLFFVFHSTIRKLEDVHEILACYPILVAPLALAMLYERCTAINVFSIFGNSPEFAAVRDDHVRAQGAFLHPILAGTFGATSLPLIFSRLWSPQTSILRVVAGLIAVTTITFTSASSGSLLVYGICVVGLSMWPLRHRMRFVRGVILAALLSLMLVMQAPVWYVFARLSAIVGGTGWHRAELLNQAFGNYYHEWWLIGTIYTRHWMPYGVPYSPDHSDITNQYLSEGVNGGLVTMLLFIWIIVSCYKAIGRAMTKTNDFYATFTLWVLGASLIGHITAFMSVPYFDQIIVHWYLLLAMIVAATSEANSVSTTTSLKY
jgi:hypothetical protein